MCSVPNRLAPYIHSKEDDDEGHELSNKGCCMYRKENDLKVLGKILWAYHTWPLVTSEIQEETKRI